MNHLDVLRQLGEWGGLSCARGLRVCICVCVFWKSKHHHITAWFPDHLKVSLRWFFFRDINRECLLAPHDLLKAASPFIRGRGNSGVCLCAVKHWSLRPTPTPPTRQPERGLDRVSECRSGSCSFLPLHSTSCWSPSELWCDVKANITNRIRSGSWRRSSCEF